MKSFFPFLEWMSHYKREDLSGDLSAGLTVGVMLIPQGMAYAMLAGLPPIYGLYAATIPLIIYALLGTSRQLAVGPVAMVALLISSGVGALASPGSDMYIEMAIILAFMVGLMQLLLGLFRLGFLVNFLSHPVIAGFTSAAAIIIAFSQMKHLLGLEIPRGKVHETIYHIFSDFSQTNWYSLAIGLGSIVILLLIKRLKRKIPGPLLVVILGIAVVALGKLDQMGVSIVANVPEGLPSFGIPNMSMDSIQTLLPTALTLGFIGFMESIAVAKAIQAKHKNYEIHSNQELIALGAANLFGSLFQSFPVAGGFGRTAVNNQSGARTGLASLISAAVIGITLLFLTSYFYYLPHTVLAAIIIVAVFGLIDFKEAKHLWKSDKRDFALFMITAVGTLALGVEEGIALGVVLSLAHVIYRVSYPHIALLGRVPGSTNYRNIHRFEQLEQWDELLILRFDAQLYFANSNSLKEYIIKHAAEKPKLHTIILDCSAMNDLDSSAIHMLHDLIDDFAKQNIQLFFVEVKGPVRDIMQRNQLFDLLGHTTFYVSTEEAVQAALKGTPSSPSKYATQHNLQKPKS